MNSDQSLYPVPILVTNLQNSEGLLVNEESSEDAYKFTRRFFLFDDVSGVESTVEGTPRLS